MKNLSLNAARVPAGGGAYYFAKRSISEDRQARFDKEQQRRRMTSSLEHNGASGAPQHSIAAQVRPDAAGSQAREMGSVPTPGSEHQRVAGRGKYEATSDHINQNAREVCGIPLRKAFRGQLVWVYLEQQYMEADWLQMSTISFVSFA
ncbi:MAG: hypothetical protein M1840_006677 [Geoglossum simile]|nr:MAG: hypothetical protein M1840_006677 [Geoglossum simile]